MRRNANVERGGERERDGIFLNNKWLNTNEKVACMKLAAPTLHNLKMQIEFCIIQYENGLIKRRKWYKGLKTRKTGCCK